VGVRKSFLSGTLLLLTLLIGCASVGPPPLTEPKESSADRKKALGEIESVIRRQLDAFKKDDYNTAFTFVSKAFRKEFPRDRFETIIRARFKEVARPTQAIFRRVQFDPDHTRAVLEVDVAGSNARLASVEYRMVLEEGAWKIDGLEPLDPFRRV